MFEGEGVTDSPLLPFKANLGQVGIQLREKRSNYGLLYFAFALLEIPISSGPSGRSHFAVSDMRKRVFSLAPG